MSVKNSLKYLIVFYFFVCSVLTPSVFADEMSDNVEMEPFGEHLKRITDISSTPMTIEIIDIESGEEKSKIVLGSDFIPVKSTDFVQIICEPKSGTSDLSGGEFYVYFYDHNKIINWDILNHIDALTGERNRVSVEYLKKLNGFQFSDIPDNSFIRIARANDYSCHILLWDGYRSGYPITTLTTVFDNNTNSVRLPLDGSACIQVPETALYLVAKPGYTFIDLMSSTTNKKERLVYSECRFPSQVIYLRGFYGAGRAKNIRVVSNYDYRTGDYTKEMPETDLSEIVIAIDENDFQIIKPFNSEVNSVYRNIEACLDFTWEAKADITDNWGSDGYGGAVGTFHKGVTYHGIPYRSSWNAATYVGWHITKQTFMNAANDPDSIFYNNPDKKKVGPYYSLVCSSFAELVCGFPYPATNYSLMKDPDLQVIKINNPILGCLMTNGYGHAFVPVAVSISQTGSSVLTLAEEIGPITAMRNVYEGISSKWKGIGLRSSYPSSYLYCVSPYDHSDIPYDITSCTIKNGSARPHRGDQSVYTSEMDVLINIKDPDANRLYYQRFDITCSHGLPISMAADGDPNYIDINAGTKQVVLRSATKKDNTFFGVELENGAIYGVWASVGDKQSTMPDNTEFFEWYDLAQEKVTYTVKDGVLLTEDVFWYARAAVNNEKDSAINNQITGGLTIPYQLPAQEIDNSLNSNYAKYAERAKIYSSDSVRSFFRKGIFGAYVTAMEPLED